MIHSFIYLFLASFPGQCQDHQDDQRGRSSKQLRMMRNKDGRSYFHLPELYYPWVFLTEHSGERERMCSRVCVYVCECVRSHLSPLCNYRFSKPEAYCDSINLWFVGWKDTDGNEVCVRECVGPHTSVDEPYICITGCIIFLSSRYVRHGTRYEYEYMYVWCVSECVCVCK